MRFKEIIEESNKGTLFCFSPEVMFATFLIEFVLAVYIFTKHKMSNFNRAAVTLLVSLGLFQLAEFQICQGAGSDLWLKIGFVSITLLPIIGLYMISEITGKKDILRLGYMVALLYVMYFTLIPDSIEGAYCGGNYVIFHAPQAIFQFYGFYYFGFVLFGVWEAWEGIKRDGKLKKILSWFIVGYLSFLVPMGVVYIASEEARRAVTSIMCGFAIILAFIIAFRIVPLYKKIEK